MQEQKSDLYSEKDITLKTLFSPPTQIYPVEATGLMGLCLFCCNVILGAQLLRIQFQKAHLKKTVSSSMRVLREVSIFFCFYF